MKHILYITTARLPTEKAHGYQICKMCEAFALNGADVTLLHPFRHQPKALEAHSVFSYYGVQQRFTVATLPNIDIFRIERFFPGVVFNGLFLLHSLLWSLWAVRYSRRHSANLYYTRDIPIGFWLTRCGMPTVLELHTVPAGAQAFLLKKIAHQKSLMLTAALTTFIAERLMRYGFAEDRIIVLPDAVDLDLFVLPVSKEECRKKLSLPHDAIIIGYIGRFTTVGMEKGVQTLIEAAGEVHKKIRQLCVLCVGGPMDAVAQYRTVGKARGLNESSLYFVDRVPNTEVPVWIKACDVVTIPWPWNEFSAYYTSPMKLFEYMASGVPIVASDLPSLREVLRHGENAWLVHPGDPAALAAGISHVLRTPPLAQKIAQQALQDVRQYTWQKRAARVMEKTACGARRENASCSVPRL
ncbi:MAG: glycosyltransferase family 4 protein [Desulfobacterota bacterium]|nr:glycosyltransferase family 4 protein [Thermodesulfobacteriota bacterium]